MQEIGRRYYWEKFSHGFLIFLPSPGSGTVAGYVSENVCVLEDDLEDDVFPTLSSPHPRVQSYCVYCPGRSRKAFTKATVR